MKRCPQCRRDYFDDTLSFCLDDGIPLIHGPGSIHSTDAGSSDPPTLIHDTAAPDGGTSTSFVPAIANPAGNENAIAVLPFANMSRDEDAEYLSDGIAEELLNVLSRINGLRVAGRTSAFSFKGKQTTFAEIGQQLNVSSVLEGSVRTAGKRVRISVQLVNVRDGYHLWSQTYDRTMDDIFAIQDDIAQSVVEEVRSRLLGKEDDPSLSRQVKVEIADAVRDRVEDPEAHRLMMLGRHFSSRLTKEDAEKAVEYFEQALEIDPRNAQCWVGLGIALVAGAANAFIDPERGLERVRQCAEQALSINGDLASAHALLARLLSSVELDFPAANQSIKKAVELEPQNLQVLLAAGPVTRSLGRFDEAVEMYRRVVEIDPLNVSAYRGLANTLWYAGRSGEAEKFIRKAVELWPQSVYSHAQLSLILLDQGRVDEARESALKEPPGGWRGWAIAIVEHEAGRSDDADRILNEFIRDYQDTGAFQVAEAYACFGQTDKAFEYLEMALATHDPGMTAIVSSVLLRKIYPDPRWQPFLHKIGIPKEYWPHNA